MSVLAIHTPHGPARVHLERADAPVGALVLGHGAGGGVAAPDLRAVATLAVAAGASVALVEQPYRVAGRRAPAPAAQLDAAWTAVVEHLLGGPLHGLSLVAGGRSSGARVACRTAARTGAVAVLCLAFPLVPPGRPASGLARPSRLPELEAVRVPTLVVQGDRDPFGVPPGAEGREVVVVPGDHGLRTGLEPVRRAVSGWLGGVLGARYAPSAPEASWGRRTQRKP